MGQWVWIQQCLLETVPTSPSTRQTPRTFVKKKNKKNKKNLAQLTGQPVLYQPCPFPLEKEVVKSIGLEFRLAHFWIPFEASDFIQIQPELEESEFYYQEVLRASQPIAL